MTPTPRRAFPVVRLKPEDVDWRILRARRASRPVGWPFAVFYLGPQFPPRRAKP